MSWKNSVKPLTWPVIVASDVCLNSPVKQRIPGRILATAAQDVRSVLGGDREGVEWWLPARGRSAIWQSRFNAGRSVARWPALTRHGGK